MALNFFQQASACFFRFWKIQHIKYVNVKNKKGDFKMKIKEIKTNGIGTVEGIVIALEEKANKNNSSFINMTVSDGETQVVARSGTQTLKHLSLKQDRRFLWN